MEKLILPILLIAAPLMSNAQSEPKLDCRSPEDGFEVTICEATTNLPTCEQAAKLAVELVNKNVYVSKVVEIQEDEVYHVQYSPIHDGQILEILSEDVVLMSAGPGGCSVYSVKNQMPAKSSSSNSSTSSQGMQKVKTCSAPKFMEGEYTLYMSSDRKQAKVSYSGIESYNVTKISAGGAVASFVFVTPYGTEKMILAVDGQHELHMLNTSTGEFSKAASLTCY